jgi:putative oxidoreductase
MKIIDSLYALYLKVVNALQSPFLLAVRLYWGWQFWQAGWGKLSNLAQATENFGNMGFVNHPKLIATFVACVEAGGGILLVLGLAARLIALPLVINMIVAYLVADRQAFFSVISDSDKFVAAAPFAFLFASLVVLCFGPGLFSLDALIAYFRRKKSLPATA